MARLRAVGTIVAALSLCGCVTTSIDGYADREPPADGEGKVKGARVSAIKS